MINPVKSPYPRKEIARRRASALEILDRLAFYSFNLGMAFLTYQLFFNYGAHWWRLSWWKFQLDLAQIIGILVLGLLIPFSRFTAIRWVQLVLMGGMFGYLFYCTMLAAIFPSLYTKPIEVQVYAVLMIVLWRATTHLVRKLRRPHDVAAEPGLA